MMQYDPEADALYVKKSDARVAESEEISPGVIVDYDAQNNVVGIEIISLSKQIGPQFRLIAAE